eukprot:Sspe_Gene.104763::Locus_81816_Transcript_1_1_Confidence_1.000_Length_301::g.104763::m.104763
MPPNTGTFSKDDNWIGAGREGIDPPILTPAPATPAECQELAQHHECTGGVAKDCGAMSQRDCHLCCQEQRISGCCNWNSVNWNCTVHGTHDIQGGQGVD